LSSELDGLQPVGNKTITEITIVAFTSVAHLGEGVLN
jgi:hypothetical protein